MDDPQRKGLNYPWVRCPESGLVVVSSIAYVHTMKQKPPWINMFRKLSICSLWLSHQRCTIYLLDWESDWEVQDTSWYLLDIDISHYERPYNPLNFPLFSVGCFPTNHDPISAVFFLLKTPQWFHHAPRPIPMEFRFGQARLPAQGDVCLIQPTKQDWSNQPEGFIGLLSSHWGSYTRWKSFNLHIYSMPYHLHIYSMRCTVYIYIYIITILLWNQTYNPQKTDQSCCQSTNKSTSISFVFVHQVPSNAHLPKMFRGPIYSYGDGRGNDFNISLSVKVRMEGSEAKER